MTKKPNFGARYGERHHRAILTDREVERLREMRRQYRYTYEYLANIFCISKSQVANYIHMRQRM